MKRITITCDLCEGPIVDYNEDPGVGQHHTYRPYKLFCEDVCEECFNKIIRSEVFRNLLLSLKNKEGKA